MIEVRVESKRGFRIVGQKIWISGTDNELFGQFWAESKENGLIEKLRKIRGNELGSVTNSMLIGVSCVEKEPSNRSFYFYIATQSNNTPLAGELEEYEVPASQWAIFRNKGEMPTALVEAEMYAFLEWLPNSNYVHDNAPEIEVYPPCDESDGILCEFWLPIREK